MLFRSTCLARTPDNLEPRCLPTTRIVKGDVTTGVGLDEAMQGVDVAYFLVHAMGQGNYHRAERDAARNFLDAAERAGVKRIVYLGALGRGKYMSKHLESRQEVGRILRSGSIPCIEFRSSVIIGSGSLSFEMVRALVDRFYDLMDLEPRYALLRSVHGSTLDDARDKLFWFLCGWLGGPNHFIDQIGRAHV